MKNPASSGKQKKFVSLIRKGVTTVTATHEFKRQGKLYNERTKEKELAKNKKRMEACFEEVHFGELIQLQHVASGRYLSISTSELAEKDRECFQVSLSEGGEDSWLKIQPRFRVRDSSAKVLVGDQVLVTNAGDAARDVENTICLNPNLKASAYYHDDRHEVNASLNAQGGTGHAWQLCKYRPCRGRIPRSNNAGEEFVCRGMALHLHHPEAEAFVTMDHTSRDRTQKQSTAVLKQTADSDPKREDSRDCWHILVLESASASSSEPRGTVLDLNDSFRLRHLATGLYLVCETGQVDECVQYDERNEAR
eukprot:g2012.t1